MSDSETPRWITESIKWIGVALIGSGLIGAIQIVESLLLEVILALIAIGMIGVMWWFLEKDAKNEVVDVSEESQRAIADKVYERLEMEDIPKAEAE